MIEAMKEALEAVKRLNDIDGMYSWVGTEQALRQAIEQAEKQDVPEPLMKIIREKFTSGNGIAVERITINRAEYEAALAQPEQEYDHASDAMSVLTDINADLIQNAKPEQELATDYHEGWEEGYKAAQLEQAEKQEPVAWMSQGGDVSRSKKHFEEMGFNSVIPLYTAPFNWVGIAVDEIPKLWGNADADLWLFAQAIEVTLKEKNEIHF